MVLEYRADTLNRAQADLPSNFEFVPLNKIQIQKLHDLGIDYNQDRGRRSTAA